MKDSSDVRVIANNIMQISDNEGADDVSTSSLTMIEELIEKVSQCNLG